MSQSINALAWPICSIDFYTFEGGNYSLISSPTNQQIISCNVSHSIEGGGHFSIELPPGGPNGIDSNPSWTTILTPMSTAIITMQRGQNSNVVMVGIIESIRESQSWQPHGSVIRTINIRGSDISIYFNRFNWMMLAFLQGNTLLPASIAAASLPALFGQPSGTPNQIANVWLTNIMFGPSGIVGKTYLNYQNKSIPISGAIYSSLENYPATDIPYGENYMSEPISWADKFRQMLPYPVYETFWGTAPIGTWSLDALSPAGTIDSLTGSAFYSKMLPNAIPSVPQMIARVLRFPDLITAPDANALVNLSWTGATNSLWNKLNLFQPVYSGFIHSSIEFGLNNLKNFYRINPTWMNTSFGNPSNTTPFPVAYAGAADPASIHRYGYYPYMFLTRWWGDLNNIGNQNNANPIGEAVAAITSRLASYCEPLSLMANAAITFELRPDIFSGNRFQYAPFENGNEQWQFYIDGVSHNFRFGGPSTTSLSLTRGLPVSAYTNSSLLYNILQGNAQRLNGIYQSGVPAGLGQTLVGYTLAGQSEAQVAAAIAQVYVTPQAK